MKINPIFEVDLKPSSSICRKPIQLGAILNSHWSYFFLIFRIKPCNVCFIFLMLDLVIRPSISCKKSLDGLIAPLHHEISIIRNNLV